jgi:hypothetical protein
MWAGWLHVLAQQEAIHYRTIDQEKIHEMLAYMGSHAALHNSLQIFINKHTKPVYGCKSLR